MQQEMIPAKVLGYAAPPIQKPRRWWVLGVFVATFCGIEFLLPRLTPDGSHVDAFETLITLAGALVLALATSVPGWAIGMYGGFGACVLCYGQLCDNNVRRAFSRPGDLAEFLIRWVFIIVMAWFVCRVMVLLRRLRRFL